MIRHTYLWKFVEFFFRQFTISSISRNSNGSHFHCHGNVILKRVSPYWIEFNQKITYYEVEFRCNNWIHSKVSINFSLLLSLCPMVIVSGKILSSVVSWLEKLWLNCLEVKSFEPLKFNLYFWQSCQESRIKISKSHFLQWDFLDFLRNFRRKNFSNLDQNFVSK